MDPASQRLTFGCEAVATPNSMRRIRAHASMSCPAYSRATWSRSRSASPQATSTSGRPDTTIVSHTHIQGVYASRSYYTYVTYMAVAARAISELPRRQSADPWRYTGTRAPPEEHPVRYWHPGPHADLALQAPRPELRIAASNLRIADHTGPPTTPRLNRVERVRNTGHVPPELTAVKFRDSTHPQASRISTGCYPCHSWL